MSVKNGFFTETKLPARISGLRRTSKGPSASHDALFKSLFEKKDSVIVSSTPKAFSAIHPEDFTENFYISDEELEAYAQGFLDVCTEENIEEILLDQEVEDESLDNIALDDSDIKLSMYRSFKSIYDKWISNSGSSTKNTSKRGYFFNNYGKNDDRTLLEHFKFVDRAGNNVGGKAVIDTNMLSELTSGGGKGPTESLYQLTSRILSKNNFDFWPTPANIPLTTANLSNEKLTEMFKSLDFIDEIKSGPIFNCVYIGGSSRILKDLNTKSNNCDTQESQYSDDSFDLTDSTDWPEDFKNSNDKGIAIFKVRYGQEAQNHFQTLTLDQQEFKETQESLEIIDRLASPKKGNSPSQVGKGNSLYDVYLTRAYNCTVSGLGNMSIQPLMYFKLDNVPMYRGTYLINSVKHKITSQKVETEFTGLRQPRITIPTVTDPISLLDLALSEEAIEGERGNLSSFNSSGGSSNNPNLDNPNNTKSLPASAGLAEVLKSAEYKEGTFAYEFALVIGTKEGYKKGSTNRPSRNNNPGNLVWSSGEFSTLDPSATIEPVNSKGQQRFAKFSTPELGAKALVEKKILKWAKGGYPSTVTNGCKQASITYRSNNNVPDSLSCIGGKGVNLTIEQFIYIYAPPSENNTERYVNQVVTTLAKKITGITRNSKIIDYL